MATLRSPQRRLTAQDVNKTATYLSASAWLFIGLIIFLTLHYSTSTMMWEDWMFMLNAVHTVEAADYSWSRFFSAYNSAIPAMSCAAFLACVKWFHSDLRSLMILNLLCMFGAWLASTVVIQKTVLDRTWAAGLRSLAAFFLFSPVLYFVLYAGWGSIWLIMPFLFISAMAIYLSPVTLGVTVWSYLGLALVASFQIGHGLLFWFFLPPLLVAKFGLNRKMWPWMVLWITSLISTVGLYLFAPKYNFAPGEIAGVDVGQSSYNVLGAHFVFHLNAFLKFFLCLAGEVCGEISSQVILSMAVGFFLLASLIGTLFITVFFAQKKRFDQGLGLWGMFGLFQVLSMLLVALLRSGTSSADQGVSLHYINLSVCLLLAATFSHLMLIRPSSPIKDHLPQLIHRLILVGLVLDLILLGAITSFGLKRFVGHASFRQLSRAQVALESVIPIIHPENNCRPFLTPKNLRDYEAFHVLKVYSEDEVRQMIDASQSISSPPRYYGKFAVAPAGAKVLRLDGWVGYSLLDRQPDAVLVTYRASPGQQTFACFQLYPSILDSFKHPGQLASSWTGEIDAEVTSRIIFAQNLQAYALDLDHNRLLKLQSSSRNIGVDP